MREPGGLATPVLGASSPAPCQPAPQPTSPSGGRPSGGRLGPQEVLCTGDHISADALVAPTYAVLRLTLPHKMALLLQAVPKVLYLQSADVLPHYRVDYGDSVLVDRLAQRHLQPVPHAMGLNFALKKAFAASSEYSSDRLDIYPQIVEWVMTTAG